MHMSMDGKICQLSLSIYHTIVYSEQRLQRACLVRLSAVSYSIALRGGAGGNGGQVMINQSVYSASRGIGTATVDRSVD